MFDGRSGSLEIETNRRPEFGKRLGIGSANERCLVHTFAKSPTGRRMTGSNPALSADVPYWKRKSQSGSGRASPLSAGSKGSTSFQLSMRTARTGSMPPRSRRLQPEWIERGVRNRRGSAPSSRAAPTTTASMQRASRPPERAPRGGIPGLRRSPCAQSSVHAPLTVCPSCSRFFHSRARAECIPPPR